jgi:ketosteroid isomerase-like protein
MSRENVEVVRRIYDAVARRDSDTPFELYADDVVWDVSGWRPGALMARTQYHGHAGVREVWRETLAIWSEVDFEVYELLDVGDRVLAALREREVGRASGVPIEATHAAVWTLAGGKVVRLQVFDDREQALAVIGQQESSLARE